VHSHAGVAVAVTVHVHAARPVRVPFVHIATWSVMEYVTMSCGTTVHIAAWSVMEDMSMSYASLADHSVASSKPAKTSSSASMFSSPA